MAKKQQQSRPTDAAIKNLCEKEAKIITNRLHALLRERIDPETAPPDDKSVERFARALQRASGRGPLSRLQTMIARSLGAVGYGGDPAQTAWGDVLAYLKGWIVVNQEVALLLYATLVKDGKIRPVPILPDADAILFAMAAKRQADAQRKEQDSATHTGNAQPDGGVAADAGSTAEATVRANTAAPVYPAGTTANGGPARSSTTGGSSSSPRRGPDGKFIPRDRGPG